jgi:hypothetical protein
MGRVRGVNLPSGGVLVSVGLIDSGVVVEEF